MHTGDLGAVNDELPPEANTGNVKEAFSTDWGGRAERPSEGDWEVALEYNAERLELLPFLARVEWPKGGGVACCRALLSRKGEGEGCCTPGGVPGLAFSLPFSPCKYSETVR